MKKRIAVVSDLHVGSIYGLLPPGLESSDGRVISSNIGQDHLWNCWVDAAGWLKRQGRIDAVVLNGDGIDGSQRAQRGSELCLPMMEDQAEGCYRAVDYLLGLLGRPKVYAVQGTEYHDAKAGREMEVVGHRLGAVRYSGLGTGRYSREVLNLEVDGVILNFAHGISVAGGLYRATPPDREGVWSALAGKAGKMPKADCVVRSHGHSFVHVEHASKHIVVSPCWQLQTRYMRRHSVYRTVPDIGVLLITVDGEAKRQRGDPCRIEKRLYDLPPIKAARL